MQVLLEETRRSDHKKLPVLSGAAKEEARVRNNTKITFTIFVVSSEIIVGNFFISFIDVKLNDQYLYASLILSQLSL